MQTPIKRERQRETETERKAPDKTLLITRVDFLQTALSLAQARATTGRGRKIWIQCGESSPTGIGTASDKDAQGNLGTTRYLYNFIQKRKVPIPAVVAPLVPTVCTGTTRGYIDGFVFVLCPFFWTPSVSAKSRRVINSANTLSGLETGGFLIKDDSIERIRDLGSFSMLHELMHWATWDTVTDKYAIADANGYKWTQLIAGSSNSPANTAQLYSFLGFGKATHVFSTDMVLMLSDRH